MLKIYNDTKIYVHSPSCYSTGGIELLHQLVDYLSSNGRNAYIVYYGEDTINVTPEYSNYNIIVKQEEEIENSPRNIEVYSETMSMELKQNHRRTQKLMWWMSVDNFYKSYVNDHCLYDLLVWNREDAWGYAKHRLKMLMKYFKNDFNNKIWMFDFILRGCSFAYQCKYIKTHLKKFGILNPYSLSDYINTDFILDNNITNRENIVLYNPSKGYEFTKQIIEASPDIKWIALKGFAREELTLLMRRAKLYIDFGNHPGKDRMPRECAINGCCIITGKQGSAAYHEDVAIPDQYKFDQNKLAINDIISKIRSVLSTYDTAIEDFSDYRQIILNEKTVFINEINSIFHIK